MEKAKTGVDGGDRVARFKALLSASGVTPEKLKAALSQHGVERFTQLSPELQDGLLVALQKAVDAQQPKN